jgi:hypothetical protein
VDDAVADRVGAGRKLPEQACNDAGRVLLPGEPVDLRIGDP